MAKRKRYCSVCGEDFISWHHHVQCHKDEPAADKGVVPSGDPSPDSSATRNPNFRMLGAFTNGQQVWRRSE